MTPIDLGLLWLLVWICKNAIMDVSHAVKGTQNPRYAPKKAQPRYGTKEWFDDLLSDGLRAQTEWRRRRAADKRAARDQQDLGPQDRDEEERRPDRGRRQAGGTAVEAGRGGGRPAEPVRAAPPAPPATPITVGGSGTRPTPGPATTASAEQDADQGAGPDVVHDDDTYTLRGAYGWRCGQCGTDRSGFASAAEAHADSAAVPCRPASQGRPVPAAGTTTDDEPLAPVVPIRRRSAEPQPNEGDNTVASEVIGLDQSIAYASKLREFAGQHGSAGNEGYIGHLTSSQVGGDTLQSAHEMQAAFDNAMAAAERHAAELERQKTVQEQYDANPDAGDKAYQQEGR